MDSDCCVDSSILEELNVQWVEVPPLEVFPAFDIIANFKEITSHAK